jgi:hypothetical protein
MYVLQNAPAVPNDAYDVLAEVFSGVEFDEEEALKALTDVLEIDADTAKRKFDALVSADIVGEA